MMAHLCVRKCINFYQVKRQRGGIVSDKLSLGCRRCWLGVAVHAEQRENKAACWRQAMKCTISPGSIVLGFLKGKKANQSRLCADFKLHFAILLEWKSKREAILPWSECIMTEAGFTTRKSLSGGGVTLVTNSVLWSQTCHLLYHHLLLMRLGSILCLLCLKTASDKTTTPMLHGALGAAHRGYQATL